MSLIDIEVSSQNQFVKNSLFSDRCRCKEDNEGNGDISLSKPIESISFSVGKPFHYPTERYCKTFEIKYNHKLTTKAKFILTSFQNKYLYYAIDDLLSLLKSNPKEKENLLSVLYSPILSLHSNLCINFFDIWVDDIYINEVSESNRFLKQNEQSQTLTYITLKLFYLTRSPFEKPESIW